MGSGVGTQIYNGGLNWLLEAFHGNVWQDTNPIRKGIVLQNSQISYLL
jgi:hypothetical protein